MRLLEGVGEKTHEELVTGKPYRDLRDFLERIKAKKAQGRSAVGKVMVQKLIVSGSMDAFFEPGISVYDKLVQHAQVQGEVDDFRYAKTGLPRVEAVDERFKTLTVLQKYLLQKSILTSFEMDLTAAVAAQKPTGWNTLSDGKYQWYANDIVNGPTLKAILDGRDGDPDEYHVSVVAYISETKPFWQGKALKVSFEVGKERFVVNMWPRRAYDDDGRQLESQPAALPPGALNGISIITLGRWRVDKEYAIENLVVAAPPFEFRRLAVCDIVLLEEIHGQA
jgi:hypothetical protein